MALQYSVAVRNAKLNAIETYIGTTPTLIICAGTVPADCAATNNGTQLANLTLPSDWMAAASSGSKSMSGTWSGTVNSGGTASFFRIYDYTNVACAIQGTIGTSSADMIVDSTSFQADQAFSISSFTITAANS